MASTQRSDFLWTNSCYCCAEWKTRRKGWKSRGGGGEGGGGRGQEKGRGKEEEAEEGGEGRKEEEEEEEEVEEEEEEKEAKVHSPPNSPLFTPPRPNFHP